MKTDLDHLPERKHHTINEEALNWLAGRITHLHTLVNQICTDHLDELQKKPEDKS